MPKSILKNPGKQSEDAIATRNRELAMHHAMIIQRQKDMEMAILESIETLMEYPLKTTDPSQPDSTDVQDVKDYLSSFRPSDFDSVVQERNLDEKCGYVLCPRPRVKQNTSAKFRLLQRDSLQVVKTTDLEKWCSDACAKRALYLRVQLKESPPWNRPATRDGGLQLLGEIETPKQDTEMDHVTRDLENLAIERGDPMNSFRAKSVQVGLQERFDNMNLDEPVPPQLNNSMDENLVEGYRIGMAKPRTKDPWDFEMIKDDGDILDGI